MKLKEWIDRVHVLPYFERRLAIAKKIAPPPQRFLYKYKPIDTSDKTSIEYIRDILVKSKLWLSSPLDFNDPFDMAAKITIDGSGVEIKKRLSAIMKTKGTGWSKRNKIAENLTSGPRKNLEGAMVAAYVHAMESTGVFSFAGDPRNILMWSHYANNHTGISIQFEVARDLKTLSGAIPVKYSRKYLQVNWVKEFERGMGKVILRKHKGWKYEKERRIIQIGRSHEYLSFDPAAITGIILGCRITEKQTEVVQNLIKERATLGLPAVQLYSIKKSDSKYQLSIYK